MNLLILGLPILLGGFSANTYQAINEDVNHAEIVNDLQPKMVSYNDNQPYGIVLTAEELNNYTFNNLHDYLFGLQEYNLSILVQYNGSEYSYDEWYNNTDATYLSFNHNNSSYIAFGDYVEGTVQNKFSYSVPSGEGYEVSPFEYDLTLEFSVESEYLTFKSYVEQDIVANNTSANQNVLTEIVGLLVGGITSLASGLGQGVSTLVSNIFLNNGGLSTFGAIIAVFGGIALAIGLSRWVMNFLTSLGAKK